MAACSRPVEVDEDDLYTVAIMGYIDYIIVTVEFNADHTEIVDIEVDFNLETASFVSMMHPSIVNQIIENQSTAGINTQNFATVTSDAVIDAVNIILARFPNFVPGEVTVTEPATEEETEPATEEETEPATEEETEPADDTDANGDDTDDNGAAEVTTTTTAAVAATTFAPGTHNGSSNNTYSHVPGNEGGLSPTTLTVAVVIAADGESITSVTITAHGESELWAGPMTQGVRDAIVANNGTAGVSAAAGATYTSNAIIEAVNNALAAARN